MEIKGPNLNSYPSNQNLINSETKPLQKGQILKAIVLEIANGKVLFDLIEPKSSFKLEAIGNHAFKPGQILSLQVANLGPPVSLNVLAKSNISNNAEKIINAALRQVIPKQTSMNQLVANLHYLSNPSPKLNELFPQEVLDLSRVLFQRLTGINDLKTAPGVKHALNSTGLFLENQIQTSVLNRTAFSNSDTRTSLLRLAESIRSQLTEPTIQNNKSTLIHEKSLNSSASKLNTVVTKNQYPTPNNNHFNAKHHNFNTTELGRVPANLTSIHNTNSALNELLRNIEGSLAKIQYNQLQHFIPDDQSKTNWFFDLPIKREEFSDIFHFMFTKEKSSDKNKKSNEWSVTLTFNLEKLGNVTIQIYLRNNKIGATVWAKNNETYNLFNQHMSNLKQQMENSGIIVSRLRCNKGEPAPIKTNLTKNILDEEV